MTTETLDDVIRQLDLFSMAEKQTALPSNGTPTSALAALKGRDKAKGDRLRILQFIESQGDYGSTCEEAEIALDIKHQTCSARFTGLADDKYIVTNLMTRRTGTNSPARVNVLTDKGRAFLAESVSEGLAGPKEGGYPRESVAGANGSGTVCEGGDVLEGERVSVIR